MIEGKWRCYWKISLTPKMVQMLKVIKEKRGILLFRRKEDDIANS